MGPRSPYLYVATFTAIAVGLAVIGLIVFAAVTGRLAPVPAGLVVLFASLAILFALETFRTLDVGDGFAVESHWGGLGGGLGDWRLLRPLMFLIATLVCAGLTFAVASPYLDETSSTIRAPAGTSPRSEDPQGERS